MKLFLPLALALFTTIVPLCADDAPAVLVKPGKIISQPDFKQPLGPEWSTGKGQWTPADGVLTAADIPDEKHIPVLHLKTGPIDLIADCEFRLNTGKSFLIGCDSQKHVGRVVIGEKSFKVCEDSTEVKGKTPSHTLAEAKVDLKHDEWQKLHVEYSGNKLAATLNGQQLVGEDAYLATPKVRWWFAAADGVQIRNVRFSEGAPLAAK